MPRLIERAGQGFKYPLRHVVRIPAGQDVHMQVHPAMHRHGAKKFLDELKGEISSDRLDVLRGIKRQIRAPAEIHDDPDQRLVHRDVGKPVAPDPGLVRKRFHQRLPERDAGVLDRVVEIHLDVAAGIEIEIKNPVPREQRQHVVEKRDPGRDLGIPLPIDHQPQGDGCFGCLAFDFCFAGHAAKPIR